ncbi:MAG: DinB family protein [Anaerolineales bacterium]
MSPTIDFPSPEEYSTFNASYIEQTRGSDIIAMLTRQIDEIQNTLGSLSETQALFRPAPAEWSIKEVLGHINDTERIFFYRALCISRGETQALPGFDQDQYVQGINFDAYSLQELIREFVLIRQANLIYIQHITGEASLRIGTASNHAISVRALIHMLAGHVSHHLKSLQTVYLPAL